MDNDCFTESKPVNDALELMEKSAEMSEKQWNALKDDETIATCRDLLSARLALHEDKAEHIIDVERELQNFKQRHHKSHRLRIIAACCGIAAASICALFLFTHKAFKPVNPNEFVVYEAPKSATSDVILELGDDETIVLNEQNEQDATVDDAPQLDYTDTNTQLANNSYDAATVQTHTITIPYGRTFKLILSDSTTVWLNANSKLVYPAEFASNERQVFLEGEAYFKVSKNGKPFIVKTDYSQTTVLGTEFNVRSNDADDVHVTLIKGAVKVGDKTNSHQVILKPGEDATIHNDGHIEQKEIDTDLYTFWKDGYFYFDQEPLKQIMQTIGKWYNVSVVFRNKNAMDYRMHFMSKREDGINGTISLMNRLKKVTLTLQGNTLYID